jgi:hypothetical protein
MGARPMTLDSADVVASEHSGGPNFQYEYVRV